VASDSSLDQAHASISRIDARFEHGRICRGEVCNRYHQESKCDKHKAGDAGTMGKIDFHVDLPFRGKKLPRGFKEKAGLGGVKSSEEVNA